jgi:hypothetical protein
MASVIIVRPDITKELSDRKPSQPYDLQTASADSPCLEGGDGEADGWSGLRIWVSITNITDNSSKDWTLCEPTTWQLI